MLLVNSGAGEAAEKPAPTSRRESGRPPERAFADLGLCLALAGLAIASNFVFRGIIVNDTTLPWEWADSFLGRRPLRLDNRTEDIPPLYPILIYLSFLLVGHDLGALHLVPFLSTVINPVLAYLLFRALFHSRRWGFAGALFLIFWPTGLFFYNQATAEPITLTIVLVTLYLYVKRRLAWLIACFPLGLASGYDVPLLWLGLFADSLLGWRRHTFHRRFVVLLASVGAAALLGLVVDRMILETGWIPYGRLKTGVLQPLENLMWRETAAGKMHLVAFYFFAYLLLPIVIAGAWFEWRRERRLWASLPLALYLVYEILIYAHAVPPLIVTLRHMTIVVPCAVGLVLAGIEGFSRLPFARARPARLAAWAYAAGAILAVLFVQMKYAYYMTGLQFLATPTTIFFDSPEVPFFVYGSARNDDVHVDHAPLALRPSYPEWGEFVLEFGEHARLASAGGGRLDALLVRGQVDLAEAWLEDSRDEDARTRIPLERWRAISAAGRFEIVDGGGESYLTLASTEGFLFGMAYPLEEEFVGGGLGDRLKIRARTRTGFVMQVVMRLPAGNRLVLCYSTPISAALGRPDGIDHRAVGWVNEYVHWKTLNTFRPEGLRALAPLIGYDYVDYYSRAFREVVPLDQEPMNVRVEGSLADHPNYLCPRSRESVGIVLEKGFDRPIERVRFAAFVSHVWPGDRAVLYVATPDGEWSEVSRAEGLGGRTHWDLELDRHFFGGKRLALKIELEAGDGFADSLRSRIPMGIRDIAVAVRHQR